MKPDYIATDGPPVKHYKPNAYNVARLAPPPPDAPRIEKATIHKFRQTAAVPEHRQTRVLGVTGSECIPDHKWARIGGWTPKDGVARVRARCRLCNREQIRRADQTPFVYRKKAAVLTPKKKGE